MQYAVNGININYTGNSNNVTVEKCKIRYNSADGVTVSGNNYSSATVHPLIKDNTISNNAYGFELYDYAKPTITGNRIENNIASGLFADSNCNATIQYNYISGNSQYGLWFVISSNAEVHRNTIKSNGTRGVTCAFNSNVIAHGADSDTTKGRNEITANTGAGIYSSGSSPLFGSTSGTQGNNWIYSNSSFEAQQSGSGTLSARHCYWSGQHTDVSGSVATTGYLSTGPTPKGWGRGTNYDPTLRIFRLPDSIFVALAFTEVQSAKQAALPINAAPAEIMNWTTDLQAAIDAGRKTGDWSAASELITALHIELQNARVPNVDFALINTYAHDLAIAPFIRKMLALALMEKDLNANVISAALAKLTAFSASNPENTAEFLLNRGALHLYRQNDFSAAQNTLAQLQTLARHGDAAAADHVEALEMILRRYQRQDANHEGALLKPNLTSLSSTVLPANWALAQNYPNPFNPTTIIRFHLNEHQNVRLAIFDLNGKRVRTLLEGELAAGEQTILWDGRDQQGGTVASGVYFYELAAGNKIERKKMTLMR